MYDLDYNPFYYPHSKYYFQQKQLGYGPLNYIYNRPRRFLDWEWPYNELLLTLPSEYAFRKVRRMIYLRSPISSIDYSYYPETTKYYRPLTLRYNYYWPLRALNYYSNYWPTYGYWPSYRYYKYLSLPSDNYWNLQRTIRFIRHPITTGLNEFSICPSEPAKLTNRFRLHKPLQLYYNYNYPIRSLSEYAGYLQDIPCDRAVRLQRIFDDETRLIRAQTASLLKRIHTPVPRLQKLFPITSYRYEDALPARLSSDNYIHRMLTTSPSNPRVEYVTYSSDPVRKYIGQGHLSCVSYAGDRGYNRRRNVWVYEDPIRSDIQLLSYYIQKFRQEKAQQPSQPKEVPLSPARPSRRFSAKKHVDDTTSQELKEMRDARAARLAKIYATEESAKPASTDVDDAVKTKKKNEEARLAEEKALAEEQTRSAAQAKKEEAARKAELARQEELAAQAAAERAAELEKQAELAKQEELAKQAEIEKAKKQEEERLKQEEQKRLEEEAKAEEERQQLLRLEEIARQAEEEKEAELARQADELAELARQEAELAEQEKKEAELAELARQEAELEDLARQEAELAELEKREQELLQQAREEAEAASRARLEADAAQLEAKLAALAQQEAELADLENQQAELDALDAEAKALEEEAETVPQESAAEEEIAEEPVEAELIEEEQEPAEEPVLEEEEAADEEEEPHAIAEDVPEGVASDVEIEDEQE